MGLSGCSMDKNEWNGKVQCILQLQCWLKVSLWSDKVIGTETVHLHFQIQIWYIKPKHEEKREGWEFSCLKVGKCCDYKGAKRRREGT